MLTLTETAPLRLSPFAADILGRVKLSLAQNDGMFDGRVDHYLRCGASALDVVRTALLAAQAPEPRSVLDFGAGAGRVTRWLTAAFPRADIHACDIRSADMEFLRETFGITCWISSSEISELNTERRFDLIWVGSVMTHLPEFRTRQLLAKLQSWLDPGGIIAFTLHGRTALDRHNRGHAYIHEEAWPQIEAGYRQAGYGYADYRGEVGYGMSVVKPSWIAAVAEELTNCRITMFAERAWADHQDVIALQNTTGWVDTFPFPRTRKPI